MTSDLGNKKVFAHNLAKLLFENGKSRNEVCDALGIKYSTMCEWLNAHKYPRIDKIEKLANYFGVQKSDLIESESSMPPPERLYSAIERAFLSLSVEGRQQALDYMRYLATREKGQ